MATETPTYAEMFGADGKQTYYYPPQARCEHGSRPSSCNDCYSMRMESTQVELLRCLSAVLTRLDLEPIEAVFPCSAMRDYIRTTIANANA